MNRDERGRFAEVLGQHIDSKGYWCFSSGKHRGKRVHRVMMEMHLKRDLRRDEVVHHRDNDKRNNGLHSDGKWNLELMDERKHNAVSAKQYWYLKTNVWPKEKAAWDEYFAEQAA